MQYENMIGLIGTLKQIEKIDEVNGLSFNGYKAIVTTERTSGAKDDAIVLITEETMRDNRTGLPKEGEAVMIAGSVQTHKNFGTGKVLVYMGTLILSRGLKTKKTKASLLSGRCRK